MVHIPVNNIGHAICQHLGLKNLLGTICQHLRHKNVCRKEARLKPKSTSTSLQLRDALSSSINLQLQAGGSQGVGTHPEHNPRVQRAHRIWQMRADGRHAAPAILCSTQFPRSEACCPADVQELRNCFRSVHVATCCLLPGACCRAARSFELVLVRTCCWFTAGTAASPQFQIGAPLHAIAMYSLLL